MAMRGNRTIHQSHHSPLSLLLLFMGGRILVPLYRGHAKRRGLPRAAGLQPRLEGGIHGL